MARRRDTDKRKKIIESATRVFSRRGFHDTKVQEIANEAGVAYGTVYLYFESKDAILTAIFHEVFGELIDYIRSEIQKECSCEGKLKKLISMQMDLIEENPDLTKLMLIEFPRTGNFLNDSSIDVLSDYIDMIAVILETGFKSGEFELNLDPHVLATMIYASLQGLATRWILDGMSYSIKAMEGEIVKVLLNGIKRKEV